MNDSTDPESDTWIRRLFARRHERRRRSTLPGHCVSFPMLLSAGKDEGAWEPIWNEVVKGAESLSLERAQLEVRSERGFHTFQYESDGKSISSTGSPWEATAYLYFGSQLVGRMMFVGHHQSDLAIPFEQLARIVDRTEDLVPEQLKQSSHPLSNEIRLSSVA